jgi:hypothetical protein
MNLSPTPLVRNGFAENCKSDREGPICRIYPNDPRNCTLGKRCKVATKLKYVYLVEAFSRR